MDRTPFGLLELGSNSLKFYLVGKPVGGQHPIETHKFPWKVAHDYYRAGVPGAATDEEILTSLRGVQKVAKGLPLDGMLAVATGVFRELSTIDQIIGRVMTETGVRIRVISGSDEAQLMARGFREYSDERPVLFCDLGGATMEWAYLKDEDRGKWGSQPLGAIRNEYLFDDLKKDPVEYLRRSSEYCDARLADWPVEYAPDLKVVATGGTSKSLAQHLSSDVVNLNSLRRIIVQVLEEGPPEGLDPARRGVFLSGLVVLWRVLVQCGATELHHVASAVRQGMVLRLIRLLESLPAEELHATLLLRGSGLRADKKKGAAG